MVIDNIAPDKVGDPVFTAPEPLPVLPGFPGPFFGKGNISYRGINPDIYNKIIAAGELHPPFESAGDTPVVKILFDPPDGIVLRVARSFDILKEGKQEVLKFGQPEEIMFLVPELCLCPADFADRIPDFPGLKVFAASLIAFIPAGSSSAMRAGTLNITVRKETLAPGAIRLVHDLFIDVSVPDKFGYNRSRPVMSCRIIGHAELVEYHIHPFECLGEMPVITFRQ
jgi:hypothetical protein